MDLNNLNNQLLVSEPSRDDTDSVTSSKKGLPGFFEMTIRRFRFLSHAIIMLPLYFLGSICLGTALTPGIIFVRYVYELSLGLDFITRSWLLACSVAAAYFIYGFSLIIVIPFFNFLLRTNLKPWRGQYYSLQAIPWYIHNGLTCLARYTFLELLTPTPFNLIFYRLMGMKIGAGTIINTTHISDPSMIELGRKVTIGGSATIAGHYAQAGYLILAKVKIGDKATIGLKCTIMGGVEIGANAKVLSNSFVVPKTIIPEGETWGGVPAVKIK